MALTGTQYTEYLNEAYIPRVHSMVFFNSWWLNQPFFEVVQPAACPGGPSINLLLDYSETTNAEVYARGAPMPDPDTTSSIRAYHTKDFFQGSAKVYGDQKAQTVGTDAWNVAQDPNQKAINQSVKNMVDLMSTTFLTDLGAHVDSATAYSDASLTRATYACAAYEAAAGGALTLADLEDMIEALQNTTYGVVDTDDLVFLCARNQLTNLSRLALGAQYMEFNASMQGGPADAGRVTKTREFEQIPIMVVPDMTNTEWYLVRRSTTKIYYHTAIETVLKDPAEWATQWLTTAGANLVVEDPLRCAKLTGATA